MIQAGKLKTRLTLQTATAARTASGAEVPVWADSATVWAEVEPVGGRWLRIAQQHAPTATHRVTIRTRTIDIRANRFKIGNRILRIESSLDEKPDGLNLLCSEVL